MRETDPRRGFALAAALFALVVLGVLSTGGFYFARQETRIGVASERATAAFYMAERGANQVMTEWDAATFGSLSSWATATVSDTTEDGFWSVAVTRMSSRLYFLTATGGVAEGSEVLGGANRVLGVVARLHTVEIDAPAAFTAKDRVRFVGKATVKGADGTPPGWDADCTGGLQDVAGMLTDDVRKISYKPGNFDVSGTPPILENAQMVDDVFKIFGDLTWDELTTGATHTISPQNFNSIGPTETTGGACMWSDIENWGDPLDPTGPCWSYFPLIHIKGPGTSFINGGGYGQGILMVDGNLWAGGNFEFYGLILVKGKFETGGSGNRVYGAVLAGNADLEEQDLTGGSLVQYSSCSLDRALENNPNLNWVRPIEQRSWVDLSSVVGG